MSAMIKQRRFRHQYNPHILSLSKDSVSYAAHCENPDQEIASLLAQRRYNTSVVITSRDSGVAISIISHKCSIRINPGCGYVTHTWMAIKAEAVGFR